jgi:hypothetical protein
MKFSDRIKTVEETGRRKQEQLVQKNEPWEASIPSRARWGWRAGTECRMFNFWFSTNDLKKLYKVSQDFFHSDFKVRWHSKDIAFLLPKITIISLIRKTLVVFSRFGTECMEFWEILPYWD